MYNTSGRLLIFAKTNSLEYKNIGKKTITYIQNDDMYRGLGQSFITI